MVLEGKELIHAVNQSGVILANFAVVKCTIVLALRKDIIFSPLGLVHFTGY